MILSAATGDGVDAVLDTIVEKLGPESELTELEDGSKPAWSPL
jgi:hypothetical protein